MASVTTDPNGRKTIQFIAGDGKRRSVRLGKVTDRIADEAKGHVEHLNQAATFGTAIDTYTQAWLGKLTDRIKDRIAAAGLIQAKPRTTLKAFLADLIAKRGDVKPATLITYQNVERNLLAFFGDDKPLAKITKGCAKDFRLHLITEEKLADNTVRRRIGIARQFFRVAVESELIPSNPFTGISARVLPNRSRQSFISREVIQRVIDACPDAEWRLIVALSRYGGLRCPSEHLGLRWEDIDWTEGRMLVHSPKTEHHVGGESRIMPIFPELLPYLEDARELAGTSEFVVTRYRDVNANLRTQMLRIMRKAQVKPWPKLFHNLRATRQTELENEFPTHVVCAWLGNSPQIAERHYLQVTDDHFAQAVKKSGAESGAAGSACERTETKATGDSNEKTQTCAAMRVPASVGMGDGGLEPSTSRV